MSKQNKRSGGQLQSSQSAMKQQTLRQMMDATKENPRDKIKKTRKLRAWIREGGTKEEFYKQQQCVHGYSKRFFCLDCHPSNVCKCGSGKHRVFCCEDSRKRKKYPNTEPQPSQPSQPTPSNPQPEAKPESTEPAPKMRKVMIGSTEFQVENGVTLTIAGIPVTIG